MFIIVQKFLRCVNYNENFFFTEIEFYQRDQKKFSHEFNFSKRDLKLLFCGINFHKFCLSSTVIFSIKVYKNFWAPSKIPRNSRGNLYLAFS